MKFPFEAQKGLIIVPTRIYNSKRELIINLALDTGAVQTMISWTRLLYLGYDPAKETKRIQVITASGIEFVPVINLIKIEALGKTALNLPVLCHTLPQETTVDGLLGLNFFKDKTLTINFKKHFIILE